MAAFTRLELHRVEHTIKNRRARSVRVRFLPRGEEMTLEPGQSARMVANGPVGGDLEVAWQGTEWAIYPWPGASVRVVRRKEIVKEIPTAPRLPEGMTTRAWCEEMDRDVLSRAG